ncbi:MAG: apolipoprotein N-acyltransferase [Elusimicrobia bacterium]|nr:apolipoprotein N-acyltransferase [Elusimicrobiota bacterium]
MDKKNKLLTKNNVMLLASALLLILAFPKFSISFLAWVCLIPLLISIEGEKFAKSFLNGLLVGFIFYAGTMYWIVGTLRIYGGLSWSLSLGLGALLMVYLALYFGLFCGIVSFFNRFLYSLNIFLIACLWVALEYLRTYLLSGFPWNLLGYSQWNNLIVAQLASFTGAYGVSFVIVLFNALAAKLISFYLELHHRRQSLRSLGIFLLLLTITFGYGIVFLALDTKVSELKPIKTAIIQANIPPNLKWTPAEKINTMRKYQSLVDRLRNDIIEVIVFPETAAPGLLREDPELLHRAWQMAKSSKANILIGSLDRAGQKFYTSCFCLNIDGEIIGQYNKTHLVPFGETFPYRKYLEKIIPLVKELGDFTPGHSLNILKSPHSYYGVNICYEDIFPDLVRQLAKNGAEVLVNISIDSWYLDTAAPYQHFYMNVFRAIENRRWVIRSTASGISGYIDPHGFIYSQTQLFQPQIAIQMVTPENRLTFYTKYGDVFAKACVLLLALGFSGGLIRRKAVA